LAPVGAAVAKFGSAKSDIANDAIKSVVTIDFKIFLPVFTPP
jgi:hypothetical protein